MTEVQKPEVNYAESDRKMMDPTLAMCRRQGSTHRAYGLGRNLWSHWTNEQKAAYSEGYDEQASRT